jgi:Flp pilus assembly protein TadG
VKSFRTFAARSRRKQSGVTALEVAISMPLFLGFVFAIFQMGMLFATQELLESAAHDIARSIRIGTITGSSYSTPLATLLCSETSFGLTLIPACSGNVSQVKVWIAAAPTGSPSGAGFKTLTIAPVTNAGVMSTQQATLGSSYDVVLQLGYKYPWTTIAYSGSTLLVSTVVLQNEPY